MEEKSKPLSERTHKTIILYSDDLGKVIAAFNIALGAAAMGFGVTIFFTYWGLSVLKKENIRRTATGTLGQKVFSLFIPKGPSQLIFSRVHFFGFGTWMAKRLMKKQQIALVPELLASAREMGVRLVGCQMSLDFFGIKSDDLIDGVEVGGAAKCLECVSYSDMTLFI